MSVITFEGQKWFDSCVCARATLQLRHTARADSCVDVLCFHMRLLSSVSVSAFASCDVGAPLGRDSLPGADLKFRV